MHNLLALLVQKRRICKVLFQKEKIVQTDASIVCTFFLPAFSEKKACQNGLIYHSKKKQSVLRRLDLNTNKCYPPDDAAKNIPCNSWQDITHSGPVPISVAKQHDLVSLWQKHDPLWVSLLLLEFCQIIWSFANVLSLNKKIGSSIEV